MKMYRALALAALIFFCSPVWAAWGVLQQAVSPQVQATTVSAQLPTQVTAGDLLIVHIVWANSSTVTSLTDTLGNTYSSAAIAQGVAGSNLINTQVFYASSVAGGTDRITVTIGSATFLNMYVYEVAGAASGNPLDTTVVANGTGLSQTTPAAVTGAANDLVFVATGHHYGSDIPGAGFTGLQANATGLSEYETVNFAGTAVTGNATLTNTNPFLPWAVVLTAFKSNSGSSSGPGATLTSIQVTPAYPTLGFGQNRQLFATGSYSDGSIQDLTNSATWASSNTAVATLSASGQASAVGHGTTTITATSGTISGSTPLLVEGALSSIQVTPANGSAPVGTTQQFTATGTFTDGSTENISNSVSWSSSNTGIATIDGNGVANAVATGTATITATSGATNGLASFAATAPPTPVATPGTQGPLVQADYQWFNTGATGKPPSSGPSACSPAPCIAQTFLNANTAGNMIFVWVSWNAGISLTSLTDSAGNTYTHVPGYPIVNPSTVTDDFWVAYNVAAAANNKITALFATGTATATPIYLQLLEYSGIATSNAFDTTSNRSNHPQCVAPCTLSSAPSPATSQAKELVLGVFDFGTGPLLTAGSGWTPDASCFGCLGWESDVSGQTMIEHRVVTSFGSYTATINDSTAGWPAYAAYVFTFKMQ